MADLPQKNKSIVAVACDVSSHDDLTKAIDTIAAKTPFVNVVIANHGATGPTIDDMPRNPKPTLGELRDFFWKTPMTQFTDTYGVNCSAVFYCFIGFLNLLEAGNTHAESPAKALGIDSQFIVTSSIAGFSRIPGMGYAYSSSKAGVMHMIKMLATNFAEYHIRTNCIAPGIYPSAMSDVRIIFPPGLVDTCTDIYSNSSVAQTRSRLPWFLWNALALPR